MVTQTILCSHCGSAHFIRHGRATNGKQKYRCRDYGRCSRQNPGTRTYDGAFQACVLAADHERCSQRGVCRIFGISRQTLANLLLFLHEHNRNNLN